MKKILALCLSLAMLFGIFMLAGCGKKETNGTSEVTTTSPTSTQTTAPTVSSEATRASETATDAETTTVAETVVSEETTTEDIPVVPIDPLLNWDGQSKLPGKEDIDFGGKTFLIAVDDDSKDGFECGSDIYSEENTAVATAVRNRTKIVQSLYNCKIETTVSADPVPVVYAEVTSGKHTIDAFATKYRGRSIPAEGNCYNLYSLGIDFSNDWWDQNYISSFSVRNAAGNKAIYSMIGDFVISSFRCTHVMMMNKNVYDTAIKQGLGYDIYALVREGKWTMDVFAEMIKAASVDNSGNSELHYKEGDILGWTRTGFGRHGLHAASALPLIVNNDGVFDFQAAKDASKWTAVIDKAIEIWDMPQGENVGLAEVRESLTSGKALFGSQLIYIMERMRDVEGQSFGLVPYPKYSEEQEHYAHYVDNHVYSYCVPISVTELTQMGDFFEIFAAHSRKLVRPVWVDTFAYEYCGDADSAEMLDIILDSRTYDPGYLIFPTVEAEINQMIDSGKNNISKWSARKEKAIRKEFEDFVKDISDNVS